MPPSPSRVLVTRPQPAAAATAARLEAMGHTAILLPMMQAAPSPRAALDALALPHVALAVTSAEAIRTLAEAKNEISRHLDTPMFCVGAATTQAAQQCGFRSCIVGPGTGVGLAKRIAGTDLHVRNGAPILYLAGRPRSPDFESALGEAGIAFRVSEIYRMSPIAHSPAAIDTLLETRRPEAVLFYSPETVRHFFDRLAPVRWAQDRTIRILCLSERVAAALPEGFASVAIAGEPNEDSLLDLL